jgi:hypothetical protein
MEYLDRHWVSIDWISLLMVVCLVILAVTKYLYPKRFHEFILLGLSDKYFLVHGKNDEILHPFNVLLFLVQVISASLFIYLFLDVYNSEIIQNPQLLFVQICMGYIVFVLVKFVIEKLIGSIFSVDSIINNYLYQKLNYRNLLALIFFMGNLIFFYSYEPSLAVIFTFIGGIVISNLIFLLYSYKRNSNLILRHFFYFILYLCALEISPYVILYKVLL